MSTELESAHKMDMPGAILPFPTARMCTNKT
eukprot:CAMPEP_0116107446 /NCGR_PEP_ID=MMETSP0327-20121206/16234_1 /TAXON_ID=44447 /ORGANISM="Pseudo-nitzschia delicatissima, Strain B596" /LENGTH=30 /DNA_ID= /DNA_START= /DNA_END= /DNA_ORIENTATION=